MVEKSDVAAVLELIRPSLQADGGDVTTIEGLADTVDSARALLADPNWARAVTDGAEYLAC